MDETPITVREAKEADIEVMHDWGMNNWQLWSDEDNKFYDKPSLLKMLHADSCLMLVAADGEKLIGMFIAFDLVGWALFDALYVEPSYRRNGIAKKLFDEAFRELGARGIKEFDSTVNTENADSLSFHEKYGFKKTKKFWWVVKTSQGN